MKMKFRTTLIASTIATLLATPLWAANDTAKDRAQNPDASKAEIGQPQSTHPAVAPPAYSTPQSGATTSQGGARLEGSTGMGSTARTPVGDNPLYTRSAEELDGVEVLDSMGENIGEIEQIVLAPDRKSAYAVISVGGVLGIGERDIRVSLDELKPLGDKLQLNMTKDEFAALSDDAPDMDKYVEVEGDAPISGSIVEFSAFDTDKDSAGKDKASPAANTPMTPKSDAYKPAASPETPKAPQ